MASVRISFLLLSTIIVSAPAALATPVAFQAQCGVTDPIVSGSLDSLPAASDFSVVPKAGLRIETFGDNNNDSSDCQNDGDCWEYWNVYDSKGCGLVTVNHAYAITIAGSTYGTEKAWEPVAGDKGPYAVCPALKIVDKDYNASFSEVAAFVTSSTFGKSGMASFDGSFSVPMKNDFGTVISVRYGYSGGRLVPLSFTSGSGSGKKQETCKIKLE